MTVTTDYPTYLKGLFIRKCSTFIDEIYDSTGTGVMAKSLKRYSGAITEVILTAGGYLFTDSCPDCYTFASPRKAPEPEAGETLSSSVIR